MQPDFSKSFLTWGHSGRTRPELFLVSDIFVSPSGLVGTHKDLAHMTFELLWEAKSKQVTD